ncbi:hypothetical protein ACGFIF_16980 [Kribbella sp. NPDC049174]|uniref:hypothetical protein n=1 Tax=Kribbella sp. NPDC049174 TaxID=3364112 RepID=UPI0037236739
MSTIDAWMLALIGVATPLICFGGLGWAYRMEQRGTARKKKASGARRTKYRVGH